MPRRYPKHLIPISLLSAVMTGCLQTDCVNEVSKELASPDGKMKIILFSRDCGATTGFNTQATVLDANESLPDSGGNAFIIDHGEASVSWQNDSSVLVLFDRDVRVFKKEVSARGVAFEYRQK
jgi:hypothetical protein